MKKSEDKFGNQWEYKIYEMDARDKYKSDNEKLNSLGKEGWELVSVNNFLAYFKRRKFDKNKSGW